MEYYSAIKKNNKEILLFATWMDLESILLSEISQTEENKYSRHLVSTGFTYGGPTVRD